MNRPVKMIMNILRFLISSLWDRSRNFISSSYSTGSAESSQVLSEFGVSLQRIAPGLAHEPGSVMAILRGRQVVILPVAEVDKRGARRRLHGFAPEAVIAAVVAGELDSAVQIKWSGAVYEFEAVPELIETICRYPKEAMSWFAHSDRVLAPTSQNYFDRLDAILFDINILDFHAHTALSEGEPVIIPFDLPSQLPPLQPATPRVRSALFLRNNYYQFACLAEGLSARGWDVATVSFDAPDARNSIFAHGADFNLFDADSIRMREKGRDFFRVIPERFGSLQFYGMGYPTFFDNYIDNEPDPTKIPWDLLELRRHRLVIGYTPTGCHDGGLPSSIYEISGGLCDHCNWQNRPDVCAEGRSLAWNRKLDRFCDWVGLEGDYATPERVGSKTVYGPIVTALDTEKWRPDLEVPEPLRLERQPGELILYHAFGNYDQRTSEGRDIKGTDAVRGAVKQLNLDGIPIRMYFAHNIPSKDVRFIQIQADIVVDQLYYGRYGANARECLMLGKPTICRLSSRQAAPLPSLRVIDEAPLVHADAWNVVDVIRALALDPKRRREVGERSRAFAVAWHGADVCAERYERVIDRVRAGLPPDTPDLYPAAISGFP